MAEEISWWASDCEQLLGLVAIDRTDKDYFWTILARDRNGCFRSQIPRTDYPNFSNAEDDLIVEIIRVMEEEDLETYGWQGDETNAPIDLLRLPTDFDPGALHPYFRFLLESPAHEPARQVIKEIGPWLAPSDPHLVSEFQNKGFDQRLWELYLWAAFRDMMLDVEQLEAPDFRCTSPGIDFTVEATTVAPSMSGPLAEHPNPTSVQETAKFLDDYMPIKFASALTSKLNKTNRAGQHYWEREESKNKPFLLAIADFHKPASEDELGSMTYTQSALWQYLYGQRVYWEFEGDQLIIKPQKIENHSYESKAPIPSGFFDLELAKNVSAVIFSNAGTLSKFNRMGIVAGFDVPGYIFRRIGLLPNPDQNATFGIPFSADIAGKDYEEYWAQEVQIFHNPNAISPISFEALLGAVHHFYEDGMLKSVTPADAVLSSHTLVLKLNQ